MTGAPARVSAKWCGTLRSKLWRSTSLNEQIHKTCTSTYDFTGTRLQWFYFPLHRSTSSLQVLKIWLYENYGHSPGRRDASVGLQSNCNTFDSIHDRYESIQTVTKPTQKEEGQLGGQTLLVARRHGKC